jgi:anti-sigma factor RsiW
VRAHAAACTECAARVEEARAGLALAGSADVPEPSPLYWEAMRRNVERRIAEEPRRASRWAWLAPLAAAAVAVVALTTGRVPAPAAAPEPTLAAWSALPPADEDVSLEVLEGLVVTTGDLGPLDEDQGMAAFLAGLSDEEGRALADSLRGQGGMS